MANRHKLIKEEILRVPMATGIYRIHSSFEFPRLSGQTNVLYIGKADNLRNRLLTFPAGFGLLDRDSTAIFNRRKAIKRFWNLKQTGFDLLFSFEICDDPRSREMAELQIYEKKHLELPPLNHNISALKVKNINQVNDANKDLE